MGPKLPTPKFEFHLGFLALTFRNASKNRFFKKNVKVRRYLGDVPSQQLDWRGRVLPVSTPMHGSAIKKLWGKYPHTVLGAGHPHCLHGSYVYVTSCQITTHMARSSTVQRDCAKNGTPQMMDGNRCIQNILCFCINPEIFVLK